MFITSQPKFVVKSEAERFVMGEVYFPSQEDSQGEFMLPETVRKIAHDFLMAGRVAAIDRNHDFQDSGNLVAESFVARKNDPDGFAEGAWVVGAYILNDIDWHKVQKGEHNGWSWAGPCSVQPALVEVDQPIMMAGKTETWPDLPDLDISPHDHELEVRFDPTGKVILATTGPALHTDGRSDPHTHKIDRTTATAEADGHSHRLVIDRETTT
jgi:hypothetical protein